MGFNSKNWNSTTLTTSDLNRIEKGIKDSHDTLDLLGEEVSALQLRQISNQSDIKTLLKDTPTLAATLNEIENLLNKDNKVLETIRDINQLVTKQELDARLFGWIKITDIKQDGNSIYDGDSIINIKSKPIDTSLDINSNNAISNKAVTKALNNLNLTGNIPTKLAELSQDSLHQTVTASEKSKWNSILETLDNIILTETDPTVPDWAKQKTKPYYDYAEIINTPAIPTNADFTLAGLKEKSYNSLTDKPIIPTKTSQLTNDSNFVTTSQIPTKTSQLTNDSNFATTSQIPDTSGFVPNTRTINNKALSSNISLSNKDVGALPDYTINISHQTAGNPRMVKFVSVNYANKATCFKMGAMTCHDNGVSYQFLTDILIAVTTGGVVTANIYKFAQTSIGNVDGIARYTGDVFYVNNTTNKIVDFYILCGQWSVSQFTPVTKVGSTTIAYVTQYSGTATYYSSGDKTWVNGCGTTYARLSDIPTNYVTTNTEQTITGKKTFSTNGLTVSGRVLGSGDDEGIVVSPASNNYAGICLGNPNGKRAVLYLRADGSSVWRYNNGSTSYDLTHPQKAGTIALIEDCLQKAGGTMTGAILFPENATYSTTTQPTALSYGRLQAYGTLNINGNTDNSGTEYVNITAGHGCSSSTADGLSIGTDTLTWKDQPVALKSDISVGDNFTTYTVIDATALNENTWYPVTFDASRKNLKIMLFNQWNGGTPSWATHSSKNYGCVKIWETTGSNWGELGNYRKIHLSVSTFTPTDPVRGVGQLGNSSTEYVYVRGGGKYNFYTSHNVVPVLRTSTYTASSQSVAPTTTAPAEIIQDVMTTNTEQTITANKIFNGTVRINGTIIV